MTATTPAHVCLLDPCPSCQGPALLAQAVAFRNAYAPPNPDNAHARFKAVGPDGVTTAELLAPIVGVDAPGDRERLIASESLITLRQTPAATIAEKFKGLGPSKAVRLLAALELGRRAILEEAPARARLDAPESVAAYLSPRHAGHACEVFGILALDSKHHLLGEKIVATGGRHSVAVTPADVYAAALPFRPRSVVAFHNHPSGDPHPSEEDKALTYRLARSGEVLGIALVDHIVLGSGSSFASFKQLGLL